MAGDYPQALSCGADDTGHYSIDWMAGAIGHRIHYPHDLYEKAAQ
ncbi:hypothetical protein [Mycolicibacterium sp. CBMA 234]|nr:hypothetical protein [Mycolicibacterium sp. CBMA 234]